ncbi:hypothetical protein NDU88_001626 [Pleurodeles waltl]|uniref:Uncharacterized protein n=1 Tax=Pleurodeles waltl TaxID=8319 RepID=A0AAV7TID5_PLEWA|nr:hypothetical protein NDU88_001626 [Pleurodeles waltl]
MTCDVQGQEIVSGKKEQELGLVTDKKAELTARCQPAIGGPCRNFTCQTHGKGSDGKRAADPCPPAMAPPG